MKGVCVVMAAKRSCFGGVRFSVQKAENIEPEWIKLKLKPSSKGYALKVLRKTPLCDQLLDQNGTKEISTA
jgi:hypothetical protein